jgi:hypothetical protein
MELEYIKFLVNGGVLGRWLILMKSSQDVF